VEEAQMPVAAFDTLKFSRQLKDAGIPDGQADAQTSALAEALQTGISDLARGNDVDQVRSELKQVRTELKAEIEVSRSELKNEIDQFRTAVKNEIDQLENRMLGEFKLQRQESLMLRWMNGAVITMMFGMFLRVLFGHF